MQLAGNIIYGILHFQERYHGKGYPEGLKGEKIPVCARILAVAGSYNSMTADRLYKSISWEEYAISELKRCKGIQFDPQIVETFLNSLGKNAERGNSG